ncbi:MAG: hypothetical protein KGR26_06160 [Cyanobacteria bacterium REEB65]|nr:hypothetical protein [Cyanobacteria bacterium REEB65]
MENANVEIIGIRHGGTYHIDRDYVLEILRSQALDTNPECAEQTVVYFEDADNVFAQHGEFEPDPEDIMPLLPKQELADWRRVMILAATLTMAAYLDNQVENDIAKLNAAIQEAYEADYEVTAIHDACIFGWAPTFHEGSWATGTFHEWRKLEGGRDAYLLAVSLSDGGRVWLELISMECPQLTSA